MKILFLIIKFLKLKVFKKLKNLILILNININKKYINELHLNFNNIIFIIFMEV